MHTVLDETRCTGSTTSSGKEATQDLHVLRFANSLFGGAWNSEHIEAVQIDVPETLDIDDRAVFYDATGAMLDMLVTHLFQVAAEVAMEPPREPRRRRPAGGPGGASSRCVPAAGPGRGGARAVRRLPRRQGRRAGLARPTPSSPRGCGSTTTAGAACRS